jgi:cell division septal protein FtsQ
LPWSGRRRRMRDYKNVKVPKQYRTQSNRTTVKRVTISRGSKARSSGHRQAIFRFLIALFVAVGGYFGWLGYQWIAHAEAFQISGVDVQGVRRLTEDEIRDIGGIFAGQNIFLVDIDAAARQARSHPWVKDVRIHRRLPNRISMIITERSPNAVLDAGGERYLIDDEGVAIERRAKRGDPPELPLVVIRDCAVSLGERVVAKGIPGAMDLLSELAARKGWRLADVAIKADSTETLSLLYAGREFKMGSGDYGEKLRRLGEVMEDVKQRGQDFAYVDLRPERQAAVMMKKIVRR